MKQKYKNRILVFLPVMKELEAMGLNPVKVMFDPNSSMEIEKCYIAIHRAKVKYPKWYKEVSSWIDKLLDNSYVRI